MDALALALFAARKCNGFEILVRAHQREAQIGFAGVSFGIDAREPKADEIAGQ